MPSTLPTHGGPDALGVPSHDFSTNGNGCGACPGALAAVQEAALANYPDPSHTALREALGRFHSVAPARIVVAASASEFVFRITAAFARQGGGQVRLPAHSYGDYARAAAAWGLAVLRRGDDAAGDLRGSTLHWACDPSSPLGQADPALAERIDHLPPQDACVLDLAYEPLRLSGALALDALQRDRVWQLWTPNKALGLTGVRAAYAIAPAVATTLRDAVDAMAPSWPVGAHGVALLDSWTSASTQHWLAGSRVRLAEWKVRQQALCADIAWPVLPSDANFFCARPSAARVPVLVDALRAHGIKLRDAASFGLPGAVRLAVLPPASQEALRAALRSAAAR